MQKLDSYGAENRFGRALPTSEGLRVATFTTGSVFNTRFVTHFDHTQLQCDGCLFAIVACDWVSCIVSVCMYASMYACMYVCLYVYVCMCVCTYVCVYVCMDACIHVRVFMCL
jgi:hypothetical protein